MLIYSLVLRHEASGVHGGAGQKFTFRLSTDSRGASLPTKGQRVPTIRNPPGHCEERLNVRSRVLSRVSLRATANV